MSAGVSIYFWHESLTPSNVRLAWHDAPAVPRVGDLILPHAAQPEGLRETWVVRSVQWFNNGSSVDVKVADQSTAGGSR